MASTFGVCQVECRQEYTSFLGYTTTTACKSNEILAICSPETGVGGSQIQTTQICAAAIAANVPCQGVLNQATVCYTESLSTSCAISVTTTATATSRDPTATIPPAGDPSTETGNISTNSPKSPKSSGLSPGAIAGIAIVTAVAGAVIAGITLLFLFQRYRKRHQQQSAYAQHMPAYNAEVPRHEKAHVNVAQTAVAMVDTYLPQPAEDDAITGEMSRIRDKIKNHVQSYYHTSPVNANVVDQSKLKDIAGATGLSTSKLEEMLCKPHSRMAAVRLYLAWVILSRCGTQKTAGGFFLPGEVASFATFLSGVDCENTGKIVLASKWKAISGELLRGRYGQQASDNTSLEQNIGQAIVAADSVLAPFVNTSIEATSDKRIRNLDSIMRRAAQFAFLLFSQPSSFSFDWVAQQGRLVVFPGLQQTVNEDGYACRPPRVFSEPEVVAGA